MVIVPDEREGTLDERTNILPPQGPRVRWAGVMSGFFVAIGVLMMMGALGLAIGVTALGDPHAATGETASGLAIGAGLWAFITMLVALFLGGMVSTTVTDRPDRPGALIHGVLVWVLFSLFTVWLMASGISLGLSGLFGALSGLTRGIMTALVAGGGDLVQALGLNDPNRVMDKLDDPATVSTLAAATGMSTEEARAALGKLRARVQAVRDSPARVAAEVRESLAQYVERAKQRALVAASEAQRGSKLGSWITLGVLVVGVGVSIAGAMRGVPMSEGREALRKALESAVFKPIMDSWKLLLTFAVTSLILAIFVSTGYNMRWMRWTGFQGEIKHKYEYTGKEVPTKIEQEVGSPKKLWDWLQLLIVPILLAIGVWWLNKSQKKSEQQIETDRQRQRALEEYFVCMTDLLLKEHLRDSTKNVESRSIARTRTLAVLRILDGNRKVQAIQFLYESGLIMKDPIIHLTGADLAYANFNHATLRGSELRGVYFNNTHFREANLNEADLRGSDFSRADLTGAKLTKTNLKQAILRETMLHKVDLTDTIVEREDLSCADLKRSILPKNCRKGDDNGRTNL